MARIDAASTTSRGAFSPPSPTESPEDLIARSWWRSLEVHHLDPEGRSELRVLAARELREHRERIEPMLQAARTGMEMLFRQVRDAGYLVLLTDAQGIAVEFIGNPALDRELRQAGLHLGGCWSEEHAGTCAVGLCLVDRRPITVHHAEHFRASHASLTCSAAPILGPDGSLLAVLDASALHSPDDRRSQHLVLQMVRSTARMIENAHFLREYQHHWVLRVGGRRDYLEVATDGLVALDDAGCVLAASQPFMQDIGGGADALVGRPIEDVFGLRLEDLLPSSRAGADPVELRLQRNGSQCFALLRGPRSAAAQPATGARGSRLVERGAASDVRASKARALAPALARLAGEDSRMLDAAHQALRVLDKGITVLLHGESGTGKEAFARAMHEASARSKQAFVALNCAAIPESLIESELFGYRDGAFTGARSKGARGLIAQAHGGTLFLDEIGDMPLALQTRLLRVLAEREIVPLGGAKPVAVDLQVICASHRNLDELIESGHFRADLYHRLAGITLTLTPLRERQDRAALIDAVLADEARSLQRAVPRLAETARAILASHGWPGNVRQLKNVLRTSLALCEEECLAPEHLPAGITAAVSKAMPPARLSSLGFNEARPVGRPPAGENDREALLRVLRQHRWNISQVARSLETCRSTVYRRMQRHAIVAPNLRDTETG